MLLGLPWALGTMAWGGTAFLIRDWRWLQLVVSLPLLIILPVLFFMDESPRWLIVRGRHDQAVQVLRKAARWNRVTLQPEADLRVLMNEIQEVVRPT
ncbi:Solute carrier family 22 member 11 [Portunus trituberculatus]|uniref:Solute carrier family 22 member 11 n=1 Tax=Portunus trituberculatus TaxID=210409 RepID=A0A5B7KL28_PORTR|nr:Solute carrier family 22 member 11 [Portunus trituberculatus]